MKFVFYNDTGREVGVHLATTIYGCKCDTSAIQPFEERLFNLPENMYPWVKMWDYGLVGGLKILVLPKKCTRGMNMNKEEVYNKICEWEEEAGESFVGYFNADINAQTYMSRCLGGDTLRLKNTICGQRFIVRVS